MVEDPAVEQLTFTKLSGLEAYKSTNDKNFCKSGSFVDKVRSQFKDMGEEQVSFNEFGILDQANVWNTYEAQLLGR